jgi:hypothetical protein
MSSAISPPSEQPGARADQASEGDGTEPADALQAWRHLLRTLGRDLPAGLTVTNAAARKIASTR